MADQSPEPQPPWSAETRSWVSLLLFIHLFAVVVAITTYTRPSGLQDKLHALFAPYLRNLHLTPYPVSYPFARFHLSHGGRTDVDFRCEVDVQGPDGTLQKVVLPPPGLEPLARYRRYQNLANATGTLEDLEGNDSFQGILPRSIAGAILKQRGASQGTFRCRADFLSEMEVAAEVESGKRPAVTPTTTYEAQVFVSDGTVELLKKSTTLETAPVESRPRTSASGGRQP